MMDFCGEKLQIHMMCLDLSVCTEVIYTADLASENSWNITLGDSILAQGGNVNGSVGNCIPGCTDPEAENYNADANIDSGSCSYTYDADETSVTITMLDDW